MSMENLKMKQSKYLSVITLLVLLMAMQGCASTTSKETNAANEKSTKSDTGKESAGEYLDDSVITTRVKTAVFNEATLKSAEINVETYKGVVQLSGFVSSQADINKAIEITHSVKGVTSVQNNMQLKTK
jgi:osmotically-inducible protein OsmY